MCWRIPTGVSARRYSIVQHHANKGENFSLQRLLVSQRLIDRHMKRSGVTVVVFLHGLIDKQVLFTLLCVIIIKLFMVLG